ncbi:hypothetical protein EVAR_65833_1 [Eumeta japonica]|uniref:Uncharacterized protein n=1 Tax=Eumeta variegata TaxID=151549 RepID=A0A4C1ZLS4_EUMVA|nr:hypothetical protein EVAR_65833_1 [Eumeta japonica]
MVTLKHALRATSQKSVCKRQYERRRLGSAEVLSADGRAVSRAAVNATSEEVALRPRKRLSSAEFDVSLIRHKSKWRRSGAQSRAPPQRRVSARSSHERFYSARANKHRCVGRGNRNQPSPAAGGGWRGAPNERNTLPRAAPAPRRLPLDAV